MAYQQSRIREYAAEHDLIIINEFWNVGVTGTINNRPELLEMFHYLDQSEDKILLYSIDRFGRDTLINIDLLKEVIQKVIKANFVREKLKTGAENFNMLILIHSGVAQSDRNIKDGRKAKILNLWKFGW